MSKEQFVETFKHTPKHLIVELLVDLLLKEDADTKVRNKYRDTSFVRHDVVEMLLYIQNNIYLVIVILNRTSFSCARYDR